MDTFNKKTVVITGAGAACTKFFATQKANIVMVARGAEQLNHLADELKKEGSNALAVPMSVADLSACKKRVELTIREFGNIHILVNNAGLHTRGDFENIDTDDVATMVNIHFYLVSLF